MKKSNGNKKSDKNVSLPRRLTVRVGGPGQSVTAIFHNCWVGTHAEKLKIFDSAFQEFRQMLGIDNAE